jgi:hypothetical protein
MAALTRPFSEYAPTVAGIKSSGELAVSRPFFYAFAVSAPAALQNGGKFSVARTLNNVGRPLGNKQTALALPRPFAAGDGAGCAWAVRGGGPEQGPSVRWLRCALIFRLWLISKARYLLGASSGLRLKRKTPAQEGCAGAKSITSAGCNPSIDRMPSVAIGFNQKKAAVAVPRGMLLRPIGPAQFSPARGLQNQRATGLKSCMPCWSMAESSLREGSSPMG